MSSNATAVLNAAKSALEGVSGLSADSVVRGRPATLADATSPPCVWIAAGRLTTEPGPDLTGCSHTLLIDVVAVPTADSSSYADREDACLTLADGLSEAIENSSTLAALLSVAPIFASDSHIDGAAGPGACCVVAVIQCQWLSDSGAGL